MISDSSLIINHAIRKKYMHDLLYLLADIVCLVLCLAPGFKQFVVLLNEQVHWG